MITQLINKLIYRKKSIYTKEERYEKYKAALKNIGLISGSKRGSFCNVGLCHALFVFDIEGILDFPEIIKHKPLFYSNREYWWKKDEKGYNIRVKILQQALKETE